ncbi:unnamed protein product [Alternaria burnsii]|nr:unnamed protein product [Alternaria burnsii]
MSAADDFNQTEATYDVQNGVENAKLSDEAQVIEEIVFRTPDGPLSDHIYIDEPYQDFSSKNLDAWKLKAYNKPVDQNNNLLPNGLCQRCHEIGSNDLEQIRALRLDNSQTAIIKLGKVDNRCKSCKLFARWRLDDSIMDQTRDYFLVSLGSVNLDLRPVQGRLCIVTDDPKSYTSSYQRQHRCPVQLLMLPMDTVSLCSQDGISHPAFGQDEYDNISQWLKTCMADHSEECPETKKRTEFTVYCIDCEDEKVVPMPHNAKYLALSYVWGDTKAPDNDDSLYDAPPIIRDAMIATLQLCFRYLWVDRYCIDQHSTTQKHQQIVNMGKIYAGATLTFIAAGDTDHTLGIPGVSSCQCNSGEEFQLGPYSFVRFFSNPVDEIQGSKWATRGWTYQEAVMSVRKLVFTPNGFYTQCNMQHSFGSTHPINGQTIISSRRNTDQFFQHRRCPPKIATTVAFPGTSINETVIRSRSILDAFFDHISVYMRRQLSYESDRLNAIQGVLNEFRSHETPLFHIFGVPFNPASEWTINATLFWRMQNHSVQRRANFPSWSWLGWNYIDEPPYPFALLYGFEDLTTAERFSHVFCYTYGLNSSLDEHSARISVEILGDGLLNVTEAHQSDIVLDTALPLEARIMPHLVIHGVILPLIFDRDEGDYWLNVDAPSGPFHKTSSFPFTFRMWLDVPDAQEQDTSRRNQVRELVLGLFGLVIHTLILRENENAWTRIGIGQYSWRDSKTNKVGLSGGIKVVKETYMKALKRHQKRTIRLM